MPQPHVIILRAPGTNCDRETAFAFERAGARAEIVHINRLLEKPALLERFQVLCIPGGFSYGDDVAAGRIFAVRFGHHLSEAVLRFRDDDKLILGICNGFQTLIKAGVLVASREAGPAATLAWNDSGKFEDRWVELRVEGTKCVFLRGIDRMYLPVAHAEGKFVPRDNLALQQLADAGQLVLRYTSAEDDAQDAPAATAAETTAYPANPNGSVAAVAGVCDTTGRVFGLMPHPERHVDPTHHPRWTRGEVDKAGDGLPVFLNAVDYFD